MASRLTVDDLLAIEEIRQAMARYSRGIDRRDEDLVKSAYHQDAYDDHGWGMAGPGWDLAARCRRGPDGFPDEWKATTHFLGQHLIDVEGDLASSEIPFVAQQIFDDADGMEWSWEVGGRYVDQWERRDDSFKILRRTVVYDWYRTTPNRTQWPGPDHSVPGFFHGSDPADPSANVRGTAGPDDPSFALLKRT